MPAKRSNLQLQQLQIETLFQCDPAGRLRAVNEPGNPPAPRFFMGRTTEGNCWHYRYDLPAAVIAQLEPLCQAEPITDNLSNLPQNYAAIKTILQAHAPIQTEYRGPNYWMPAEHQPPAHVVLISASNLHLLQPHFPWMIAEASYHAIGPVAAAVVQDQAVSICFCSRIPGAATEAGLETAPAYRRQGHAVAAVAGWAAAVRKRGCLPLYSTGWENQASQAVAGKLGMVCYGEDWSLD